MSGRMAKRARREQKVAARQPLGLNVSSGPGGLVRVAYSRAVATLDLRPADARSFAQALLTHAMRSEAGVFDAAP